MFPFLFSSGSGGLGTILASLFAGRALFPTDLRFLVHLEDPKLNLVSDGRTARGREWLRKIAYTPIGSEVWWR